MAKSFLVTQIPSIVNDAYEDIMGKNSSLSDIDTTDIVSMGKALSSFDLLDGWYGKLTNRIIKTIIFARRYSADTRKILRDEHTWGAFIQKLYVVAPDAVDNPAYGGWSNNSFSQISPYDVDTTLSCDSLLFGGEGTWAYEFVMPEVQIRKAFTSPAEMTAFVDAQFVAVLNKIEVSKEALINSAVNTGMADAIKNGKVRNLLTEYNTLVGSANAITSAEALRDKDFLKYASKEINKTVKFIQKPSVNFNIKAYETYTPSDKLITEVNSEFAQACEYYLEADTFNRNLVSLPNYSEVPYWQSQGTSQSFADCSAINVTNDAIDENAIEQTGIIACLRDEEYVACYFGDEYQWSMPNPRQRISIHGYQYKKGFAVDEHANCIVFIIADVTEQI